MLSGRLETRDVPVIDCRDPHLVQRISERPSRGRLALATVDLGFRDVRIEDVPCRNLEALGAAEIGTPVGPGDEIDIVPALEGG